MKKDKIIIVLMTILTIVVVVSSLFILVKLDKNRFSPEELVVEDCFSNYEDGEVWGYTIKEIWTLKDATEFGKMYYVEIYTFDDSIDKYLGGISYNRHKLHYDYCIDMDRIYD